MTSKLVIGSFIIIAAVKAWFDISGVPVEHVLYLQPIGWGVR